MLSASVFRCARLSEIKVAETIFDRPKFQYGTGKAKLSNVAEI